MSKRKQLKKNKTLNEEWKTHKEERYQKWNNSQKKKITKDFNDAIIKKRAYKNCKLYKEKEIIKRDWRFEKLLNRITKT